MPRTPEREHRRIKSTKEHYGEDVFKKNGALGGKKSTRGYFGYLKEHDPEKLAQITKENAAKGGHAAARNRRAAEQIRKEKS